jgi:hypothetical protein
MGGNLPTADSFDDRHRPAYSASNPTGHPYRQNHRRRTSTIKSTGTPIQVAILIARAVIAEQIRICGLKEGKTSDVHDQGRMPSAKTTANVNAQHRTTRRTKRRLLPFSTALLILNFRNETYGTTRK